MNRKRKRAQILLAISFIFFLPIFSAYLYYNNYAEADFSPAKPTFDNPDQDYLLINQESKSFTFGQNTSPFIFETYPLFVFPPLSFGISPLDQKPLTLRC
jgi:hypothetical protein